MNQQTAICLLAGWLALDAAGTVTGAEDTVPEPNEAFSHPEVRGALAAVDAWLEGVRNYERSTLGRMQEHPEKISGLPLSATYPKNFVDSPVK